MEYCAVMRSPSCLCFFVVFFLVSSSNAQSTSCDPIRIEICRGLGYNVTSMPNFVGHELQQDADMQLQTFSPLIQYGCSSQLRLFLCSVYAPMCTEKVSYPIGPCRTLCERIRSRCQPVLQEFGFPWPSALNCSKFPPENNQNHMCMEGPGEEEDERDSFFPVHGGRRVYGGRQRPRQPTRSPVPAVRLHPGVPGPDSCSTYKNSDSFVYINRTERCVPLCQADILFRSGDKQFAGVWVAVWAILCFVITLFTVLTFLIDSSQFNFPERSIIFIAMTYNLYSIGHLIRLAARREDVACITDGVQGNLVLIQEGLSHTNCAIVFLLLYYFGVASCIWWIILAFTWYLSVGLRWSHEAIERRSSYFHVAAWTIPAAQTIAALVKRVVDADELTGTCFIGQQSVSNLFLFVILPHFVYLVLGSGFFLVGFIRLHQQRKINTPLRAELFPVRIGIFSILYSIPAACVLGTNIYEYTHRDHWLVFGSNSVPNFEMFIFKIFMTFVIGIISGMWIWSRKSMDVWQQLGRRLVQHQKQQTPSFLLTVPSKHLIVLDPRVKMPLAKNGSETAV